MGQKLMKKMHFFIPSVDPCKWWAGNHSWQRSEQLHPGGQRGHSAADQALSQNRRQRRRSDRENCHYRARRERPPCEGKNKIAEQGWKERSFDWKNDSLSFSADFVQKPQKLAPL